MSRHDDGGDAANQLASGGMGNNQVLGGDVATGRRNRGEGTEPEGLGGCSGTRARTRIPLRS